MKKNFKISKTYTKLFTISLQERRNRVKCSLSTIVNHCVRKWTATIQTLSLIRRRCTAEHRYGCLKRNKNKLVAAGQNRTKVSSNFGERIFSPESMLRRKASLSWLRTGVWVTISRSESTFTFVRALIAFCFLQARVWRWETRIDMYTKQWVRNVFVCNNNNNNNNNKICKRSHQTGIACFYSEFGPGII